MWTIGHGQYIGVLAFSVLISSLFNIASMTERLMRVLSMLEVWNSNSVPAKSYRLQQLRK